MAPQVPLLSWGHRLEWWARNLEFSLRFSVGSAELLHVGSSILLLSGVSPQAALAPLKLDQTRMLRYGSCLWSLYPALAISRAQGLVLFLYPCSLPGLFRGQLYSCASNALGPVMLSVGWANFFISHLSKNIHLPLFHNPQI